MTMKDYKEIVLVSMIRKRNGVCLTFNPNGDLQDQCTHFLLTRLKFFCQNILIFLIIFIVFISVGQLYAQFSFPSLSEYNRYSFSSIPNVRYNSYPNGGYNSSSFQICCPVILGFTVQCRPDYKNPP